MMIGITQYCIRMNRLHNDLLTQQVVSKYDFFATPTTLIIIFIPEVLETRLPLLWHHSIITQKLWRSSRILQNPHLFIFSPTAFHEDLVFRVLCFFYLCTLVLKYHVMIVRLFISNPNEKNNWTKK